MPKYGSICRLLVSLFSWVIISGCSGFSGCLNMAALVIGVYAVVIMFRIRQWVLNLDEPDLVVVGL